MASSGRRRPLPDQPADRLPIQERRPEVEAHGPPQPSRILIEDRPVEAVARAVCGNRLAGRAGSEQFGGEVARREAGEQERPGRDDEDEENRESQAPREVSQHAVRLSFRPRQAS
jgi:hypothetical protein